jgi:hypothetical protein
VEIPQHLEIVLRSCEVAKRAKQIQRQVKRGWTVEAPHVFLDKLYR